MIDYSKLCQKVREALNVPIGNLEKDNQAAKKITWEDFSKRLKAEMKIENTLDECIKGSHHYEMTVKLHAGFELLLIEKKGFDEAFVYLVYNKSIRIAQPPDERNKLDHGMDYANLRRKQIRILLSRFFLSTMGMS